MITSQPNLLLRQIWRSFSKSSRIFLEKKPGTTGTVATIQSTSVEGTNASAVKDIVLYKFNSPRFYRNLSLFAMTQYGFWMYISYSSLQMVDVPVSKPAETPTKTKEGEELPYWRTINLGQDKYKYGFAIGSFLMGCTILFVSWAYILRSIRYLVLRKDGTTVSFVTYTPLGKNRIFDVPMKNISAEGSRSSGTTQMPVRVKGRRLFFLLDVKEGEFPKPQLFDKTVGTKRKL